MLVEERVERLRSSISDVRMTALEGLILEALGFEESDVDIRRLGRAYRQLSEALIGATIDPGSRTGTLTAGLSRVDLNAIWGLVYGARSFQIVSRILSRYADGFPRIADIGGGWGPAALWSVTHGRDARVVEAAARPVEFGHQLFDRLALPVDWRQKHAEPRDLDGMDLGVLSFSLREFVNDPEQGAAWLKSVFERRSGPRRVIVMESGARTASEFLMNLRDEVKMAGLNVVAPCRASSLCPLRAVQDWCHFTWHLGLGPLGQRIASAGQRKGHEVHVSWLVVDSSGSGEPVIGDRVIDARLLGKQGTRITLCTDNGRRTVDVERRLARTLPGLDRNVAGGLIRLGPKVNRVTKAENWTWQSEI